jgi:ubiquinone/menaquinone biosynthesis C-methylase UbiE
VLSREGARIADVGCGAGWSTLALARAYPDATVEGIDIDPPSIQMARRNASEAGLDDRVTFRLADGSSLGIDSSQDATFLFECLHDMPHPVDVLDAVRRATKPDGVVVIVDEAVADTFTAPADDVERIMYGFSLFVCLPDGMSSSESSEATGTVMRRGVLEGYATRAGFEGVDVLPIHDFSLLRFYRLRQHTA